MLAGSSPWPRLGLALGALAASLAGCPATRATDRSPATATEGPPTAARDPGVAEVTAIAPPVAEAPAPRKDEVLAIPAGPVMLGSSPGLPGRDPALEADLVEVEVAAFEIDRLPYPNDPEATPVTGLSYAKAEQACAKGGKRLCHELEWERACKGDAPQAPQEPTVGKASSFGMAGPATTREWTAGGGSDQGGRTDRPVRTLARCGARAMLSSEVAAADLSFRCCQSPGEPPTLDAYPVEPKRPLIRDPKLDTRHLREILAGIPQLTQLAADFVPFERREIDAALKRGKRSRSNITAWHFASSVFEWSPVRGESFLVVSGHSKERAMLAVLHALPGKRFGHARSTLFDEADATLAIGYTDDKPRRLLWTTCFGCPGESGDILYGEDATVTVAYR